MRAACTLLFHRGGFTPTQSAALLEAGVAAIIALLPAIASILTISDEVPTRVESAAIAAIAIGVLVRRPARPLPQHSEQPKRVKRKP